MTPQEDSVKYGIEPVVGETDASIVFPLEVNEIA